MTIHIKQIDLKDSFNYIKDTFYILSKNIFITILFFVLFSSSLYFDYFFPQISYQFSAISIFFSFLLCAFIYTGSFSFFKHNKIPLRISFNYSISIFFVVFVVSNLLKFIFPEQEPSNTKPLELSIFVEYFLKTFSYTFVFILSYYLFFNSYLIFFITKSYSSGEIFVVAFLANIKIFFLSYFIINLVFNLIYFYFKNNNPIFNLFLMNFSFAFSALFTFIALNDIFGLSKVERKVKEKTLNKNLELN